MTLIGITYLAPTRPHGLPSFTWVDLTKPGPLKDWRVLVRGASVVFVSPKGWTYGQPKRDPVGQPQMIEVPRSSVALHWRGDEAEADQLAKWSPGAAKAEPAK